MRDNRGWMGLMSQVLYYLSVVGADQDSEGKYLLVGEGGDSDAPSSFMGADVEVVIPSGCCYLKGGKPVNLAMGLGETSYGLRVVVI